MRKIKAQISTEYLIIMGMVLIIVIPLFYYAVSESNVNIKSHNAEDTVNTLARAADSVYSIGPGTRKYVWINVPVGVEGYSLDNKSVLMKLSMPGGTSDIHLSTKADLAGIIPVSKGKHRIKVEMTEAGYVLFGEADDDNAPEVIWTSPSGTINYNGIVLRASTNEYAICKYHESDVSYPSMSEDFVGSALTHEKDKGIMENGNYTYFVRCQDPSGNIMSESAVINFTIVPTISENATNGTYQTNETYEPDPPVISLISPEEGHIDNDSIILFEYNVTDESSILFCRLVIDNVIDQTDYDVEKNITQNFDGGGLDYGNYTWNVNCSDVHGNLNSSLLWNFSVNYSQDTDNPVVNLISPLDYTVRNYWLTQFSYNVNDATSGIDYCELVMVGITSENSTLGWTIIDSPVLEGVTENIMLPLFKANYTWNVSCFDSSYNANKGDSETWHLEVNTTPGEEAFIDSCAGLCGYNGYVGGDCRQNVGKCTSDGYVAYLAEGNTYCTVGPPTPSCCCLG